MDKTRYYINTYGKDDQAYQEAIQFACRLAKNDRSIKRVVLLAHSKNNVDWLNRLYGRETVAKLFKGMKFEDCSPTFVIKTQKAYSKYEHAEDIVITMVSVEGVMEIDDFERVKVIIAIPWVEGELDSWVKTWGPTDIRTNEQAAIYPLPENRVQVAMEELTENINIVTAFNHPSDEQQAKTYIRALHKYTDTLNSDIVFAYLVRELGLDTSAAKYVKKLIDTLNDGRDFQGGEKTGLKWHIEKWDKGIKF